MGRYVVKLPDIGEGITESEIAQWRVAVGDRIEEDQPLVDMLTEKAAVELPSPVAGKVVELRGQPGDKCAVGGELVVIETDAKGRTTADSPSPLAGEGGPKGRERGTQPAAPALFPTPLPQAGEELLHRPGGKPIASPAVRRRARELGVNLAAVPGTGRGGRVTHGDLDAFAEPPLPRAARATSPARGEVKAPPSPLAGEGLGERGAPREGVEEIKIIGLRRRIAEAMQRAKQRIPHFAYVEEVDVTELEALRSHLNANRREDQPKLTVLPFLMRALVKAVPEFPQVNATFDDEAGIVRRYSALHVGIATQTPNGLVVPVVRHAEMLDLWTSAAEVKHLADAARGGKASREELSGSTITITSLGPMGGIASTPIINAPEVAIIGVNKIVERPVIRNGQIVPRLLMNLSSSFDHRIVDGWDAAAFIQRLKGLLEHPATLFME